MVRILILVAILFVSAGVKAQLVELTNNSTAGGDVVFGATNFSETPVFLKIEFTELQNTLDDELLIRVNKLMPGYNNLFTLAKGYGQGQPYFYYKTGIYRSDPLAEVNLDFPYLIPLEQGKIATVFDVTDIDGFWGEEKLKRWAATGFNVQPGDKIYAARTGTVVEIVEKERKNSPEFWYNTWLNIITVLQPDGTLISYKNVIDKGKKLKLNQKIYAGQLLGEVAPESNEIILLIYHSTLDNDLSFIIPQFVIEPTKTDLLNRTMEVEVVHPNEIRGLELTRREQRRMLND